MKDAIKWILVGLGSFWVLGTLLPLIRSKQWWIRTFDYPRMQLGILAVATAIVLGVFFWREGAGILILVAALGIAAIYQFAQIIPYTGIVSEQTKPSRRNDSATNISLVISNVLMDNHQAQGLLESLRGYDPDIILLLETDQWWEDRVSELEERYPHVVRYPLDNTYGMLLYSKLKLVDPQINFIIEKEYPSIFTDVVLRSGDTVKLYCVHPPPPVPGEEEDSGERDAELIVVGRHVRSQDRPAIVIGDLNDVAWSRTTRLFKQISGMLDPRVGRGLYNTFDATNPLMRWPLDHLFHTEEFRFVALERLPGYGSDHFPIYSKLSFEPELQAEQEVPHPDADQVKEADEVVNEEMEEQREAGNGNSDMKIETAKEKVGE